MSAPVFPDWTPPPLAPEVQERLEEGRSLLARGESEAARAVLVAAFGADPRVALHPWGLLPHLKAQGRANLRTRLKDRIARWYRAPPGQRPGIAALAPKPALHRWAAREGCPVARQIALAPGLAEVDWGALPRHGIVVKPANATEHRGIVILHDGIDRFTGTAPGRDLAAHVAARWQAAGVPDQPVIVEDMLVEEEAPPGVVFCRDVKGYAVAGRAVAVQIVDRNRVGHDPEIFTVDRTGRAVPSVLGRYERCGPQPLPARFAEAVALIERVSARMPYLLRIDTYPSRGGPVLGEITTYPNAGKDYTRFGRRTLLQMWELYPD